MGEQLPLLEAPDSALGLAFLRILRDIVDRLGPKHVAAELDCAPSFLSSALALGRNSNHFRAEWVPWIVRHDTSGEALEFLASLAGCEVVPQRVQTAEEELAALKLALTQQLGPEMLSVLNARSRRARSGR